MTQLDDEEDKEEGEVSAKRGNDDAEADPDMNEDLPTRATSSDFSSEVHSDLESLKCILQLEFPLNAQKVSMFAIVERVAATCNLRSKARIQNCYVGKGYDGISFSVQTDGVSFETAWEFPEVVDVDKVTSNDVAAVLRTYGVEAARATIINECKAVFGPFGIFVNPRHLGLIADYMTNQVNDLFYSMGPLCDLFV